MKSTLLLFSLAIVLTFLTVLSNCLEPLDTPVNVIGGNGVNQYSFQLNDQGERIDLDIVNPNKDFAFRIIYHGANSTLSGKMAQRDTPIAFFTFQIDNEASNKGVDFGAAIRFIYNDALFNVDASSLVWYMFRSDKWRPFENPSENSVTTKTLTQGFQREYLRPGKTEFAVWGGSPVTFPDDDYDYELYDRFDTSMTVTRGVQNKYSFQLPQGESFEIEILGADRNYNFKLHRETTNPSPSATLPLGANQALKFFTMGIENNARPTYNAVFRYKWKSLPGSVDASSVNIVYLDGNAYKSFIATPSRNVDSGVVTQGASSLDDTLQVNTQIAIVAKGSSTPPPPHPNPSPKPGSSPKPSPSPKPHTSNPVPQKSEPNTRPSNSAPVSMQFSAVLALVTFVMVALIQHIL